MSNVALSGNASGTGTFTIASPNSNTDRTLNLPDNSGTVLTSASNLAGVAGVGKVLQVVSITTTLSFSTTSGSYQQIGLSAAITPSSTSSKVFVIYTVPMDTQVSNLTVVSKVFRAGTELSPITGSYSASGGYLSVNHALNFLDSPNTTSATTYDVRARIEAGAGTISTGRTGTITLMEIAA